MDKYGLLSLMPITIIEDINNKTMDKKATAIDLDQNKDSVDQKSDDTVQTDFTLIASCAFPDTTGETDEREIKADQAREFIASIKNSPFSLKQKILNLIQPK
jgi:hypothetical protein